MKIDYMKVIYDALGYAPVAVIDIQANFDGLNIESFAKDHSFMFDETWPKKGTVTNSQLEGSRASNPTLDIYTLTVVPTW
jgi:hypothetical protein